MTSVDSESKMQRTVIGKNNLITVGSAIGLMVFIIVLALQASEMRHADIDSARAAREEDKKEVLEAQEVKHAQLLAVLRELKSDLADNDRAFQTYIAATNQRVAELERQSGQRWSAPMMEVWVLQSQQKGELVDPAPIIERYSNNR